MTAKLDRPIIILGFGRSGTSIIADIVFQHDDIAYLSNYHAMFPNSRLINYIRVLFDNGLWSIKGQKEQLNEVSRLNRYTFKSAEAYAFLNRVTGRDFSREFFYGVQEEEKAKARIRKEFAYIVKAQFKGRMGFKTTGPSRLAYLASLFPDARFIWIRREPLPNIKSLLNIDFYQNRKHALWWYGEDVYSQEEKLFAQNNSDRPELIAALQYYKVNQIHAYEAEQYSLSDRILAVNYEDFVEEPEREVERILAFSGLEPDRYVSEFLQNNKIYSRNISTGYYFSKEIDDEVTRIACHGIQPVTEPVISLG